jgi:hypothetical protein
MEEDDDDDDDNKNTHASFSLRREMYLWNP